MKLKHWQNIFDTNVNANATVQHVTQMKNGVMINVNMNVKNIIGEKKDYTWNPSTHICEDSMYLKIILVDWVIIRNEIISLMNILSTNVTNTT